MHFLVSTPSVHEKVCNCCAVKLQVLCNGVLHFATWTLGLVEYGLKRAFLNFGKDKAGLLQARWCLVDSAGTNRRSCGVSRSIVAESGQNLGA